ncbi:hypothetical protein U1Q18_025780, partial [Sarracenia purpurea var. burkii]
LQEGQIIHAHFLRSHFSHYLVIRNTIVNMYAKSVSVDVSRKMFDDFPTKDMIT